MYFLNCFEKKSGKNILTTQIIEIKLNFFFPWCFHWFGDIIQVFAIIFHCLDAYRFIFSHYNLFIYTNYRCCCVRSVCKSLFPFFFLQKCLLFIYVFPLLYVFYFLFILYTDLLLFIYVYRFQPPPLSLRSYFC